MKLILLALPVFLLSTTLFAQTKPAKGKDLIEDLLQSHSELFSKVLQNPEKYQVQVLYTQINRDKNNKPSFTTYAYRTDAKQYFYPASTVKLPAVLLSLEKLNEMNVPRLTKETPLKIDSSCTKQAAVIADTTATDSLPSIAHYVKKILLVSDNDAYNRLYEFVGQKGMHDGLHNKGFTHNRLIKRLQVGSTAKKTVAAIRLRFITNKELSFTSSQLPITRKYIPINCRLLKKAKDYARGNIDRKTDGFLSPEPDCFTGFTWPTTIPDFPGSSA
jgi:hypothetical protein